MSHHSTPTQHHTPRTSIVLTAIAALCIGIAIPLLWGSSTLKADDWQATHSQTTPQPTISPDVPHEAEFAGETITLDRYDLRERLDRELMAFTYMHSTTMLAIKRANRFFPLIEPILREMGVPDDMKYLAVIESTLSPTAKSPAGAVGMWQFLATTGREYGLEVNANIDERYHVEKETRAACRYLLEAYEKYGDWLTVAASYNGGQGRITSELRKQHAQRATDLWLVEETSRYMFRLLAAKMVLTNPQCYGFQLTHEQLYPPIACREVTVNTGIDSLATWAEQQGTTYGRLKDFNPWLRESSLANRSRRTYVIRIPLDEAMNYDPQQTQPHYKDWVVD